VKGAMVNVAECIAKLTDVELHVTAHSSGAILLGSWFGALARKKIELETVSLYAPACTVKFTNEHFNKAVEKKVMKKSALSIDLLSDERERADSIGAYNKSLLYLVSRAFEDLHKEPLLGMQATWTRDEGNNVYKDQSKVDFTDEEIARFKSIDELLEFWKRSAKLFVCYKDSITVNYSTKNDVLALSHQSFCNDIKVLEATMKRMLNKRKLKYPIENLGGF